MINPATKHLHALLDLGPRPLGSPANQAAADYLREAFRAADLDVEEQPYPCTAWEERQTTLEKGGERLEAAANAFSRPCDLTAPVICAGTIPELEHSSPRGKILLLYGDLARAPLSPKAWFLKSERDEQVIGLLERLQPAALLAPPTATDYFGCLTEDAELDLPAATVPQAVARRLLREPTLPVHLRIDAALAPATARNIVARTPGTRDSRLVVCAHFDTKIRTPGASDNGAGVAALLVLAEKLAAQPGLEFVAFNGEETLPMGDDEYLRLAEGYFAGIRACVNLDGIGPALASTSLTAIAAPEETEAKIRAIAADFPGVVWVDPWPESNHSTFSFRSIPAFPLSSVGARGLAHSLEDAFEAIEPAKIEEAIGLALEIIRALR